jgi:hypothetical protein
VEAPYSGTTGTGLPPHATTDKEIEALVAHPTYQRPLAARRLRKREDDSALPRLRYGGRRSRKPGVIRRVFSEAARLSRRLWRGHSRRGMAGSVGHDILWKAKRNAFRRALSQHGITEAEACAVLRPLVASGRGGCELVRLADLAGLEAADLDRALPLMGLQNIVAIEERVTGVRRRPVVWVAATDGGRRFFREAYCALFTAVQGPEPALSEAPGGSTDGLGRGIGA